MIHSIRPADRVAAIKEYYFAAKLREIAAMRAEGADIISLGIGGPDNLPPAAAIDALANEARRSDAHSYQPFAGLPELRRAFARWYSTHYGVTLDPDRELLPLIGSKEGVLHLSLTFLNPGDGVLVPNPGYPTYTSASRLAMARIIPYELSPEQGWQPDFDALERLPLDGVKLMWVNYPNMPTGAPARRETFERLVDFARRHSIVIAHDNPYSFILNERPMSLLSVDGARDVAVELNSLSKSHNMAGWRVGMVASNPQFLEWIVKVKSNVDSGMFKPVMQAAIEALNAPAEWYRSINATYAPRRRAAEAIMDTLGCRFDPSQQGLFLWGRIPDEEESAITLCDKLLYGAGVFITPGSIFGSQGERYVRISLCAPTETINAAHDRIKHYICTHQEKKI